jgi:hypothetical protein
LIASRQLESSISVCGQREHISLSAEKNADRRGKSERSARQSPMDKNLKLKGGVYEV